MPVIVGFGLLSGCGRPLLPARPLRLSGHVVDRHTGQAVAGATVWVYGQRGSGLALGGYSAVNEPHAADADGFFRFAFLPDPGGSYLLLASAPPGYETLWGEAPGIGRHRRRKHLRLPMQAPAYVRVQLLDTLPLTKAWITVYGYSGGADEFSLPGSQSYVRRLDAHEPRRVSWNIITENGVRYEGYKDLLVNGLDTVTLKIRF
ncbi:peptidase associated/transthyretin-like domain-containing protein [Hymenobacter aquaticus]|uniref:carboxypeptidase regulatory-like domain-containing protein n=1 Tax=Hymenobacter aquaticus TaxID=1867101 RepID=UPI001436923C|nr:carboxypeptidase regulatory-like domain-containing protein [Hymenobacter aquaticus]